MSNASFLQEMQIDQWQLRHPERLEGVSVATVALPEQCRLLLLSPIQPNQEEVAFLTKVLGSFSLTIDDAFFLSPEHLNRVELAHVEWVWFCQCPPSELEDVKVLHSPALSLVESETEHKRALWKQIKSYE
ncbi:DNA polymerase III subunit psi [Vibrio nigripulchritudo]|uniref:DNA polymerase III subunit psi n=1 Tax=Vibrio nigripulchritudo TaxID=28173 RepID=UPI0024924625|nr:DNA polymerase III subunit psi [Vibrio nigripulchritudo]BDU38343.1 DNA polymerase III subunit psi [Vibrio nigripulchritudo]BDU44065.1 DNA polymerase III subunit psi [Vibrio nigripulchritudo]